MIRRPVLTYDGRIVHLIRVSNRYEMTCTGCGEISFVTLHGGKRHSGFCIHCSTDDHGTLLPNPPLLVPTLSYLREGEYYLTNPA